MDIVVWKGRPTTDERCHAVCSCGQKVNGKTVIWLIYPSRDTHEYAVGGKEMTGRTHSLWTASLSSQKKKPREKIEKGKKPKNKFWIDQGLTNADKHRQQPLERWNGKDPLLIKTKSVRKKKKREKKDVYEIFNQIRYT